MWQRIGSPWSLTPLAVTGALVLVATACGGSGGSSAELTGENAVEAADFDALVEAAQEEGSLTLYHGTGLDETTGWTAHFTEEYGIQVEHSRAGTYQMYEQWVTETQAGSHIADLVLLTDMTGMNQAADEGMLAEYTPQEADAYDEELKFEGQHYPMYINAMGIAWNTNLVSDEDEQFILDNGFDALADERWDERYATTVIHSGGTTYAWWYMLMNEYADEYGEPYLSSLADHNPDFFESKVPLYDRLVAGEYAVSDQATETAVGAQWVSGAPVRWMYPDPAPAAVVSLGISETAPSPNAARLFMEWSTSVEGQEAWHEYVQTTPAHEDAEDLRAVAEEDWFSPPENLYLDWMEDPAFAEEQTDYFDEWARIFGYNE